MKISILKYFLPYGLYLYLKKPKRKLYPSIPDSFLLKVKENSKFKGIHSSKRCFILATGPSIRNQDLKPLHGEWCFAVGEFFLHPDVQVIAPAYHVLAPIHPPFTMETTNQRFISFTKYYSKEVTYFLGDNDYQFSHSNFLKGHLEYNHLDINFLNYFKDYQLDEFNYNNEHTWDICATPFAPRTVVYIAIQVAVYMGFNEIYLLGCDHDYLQDTKRVTDHHFYEDSRGTSDAAHLSQFTLERWFEEYFLRWKQYRLMKEFLNPKGVSIYNATKGGMLDVFPRVVYEELVRF